jgi:hypothetical protein
MKIWEFEVPPNPHGGANNAMQDCGCDKVMDDGGRGEGIKRQGEQGITVHKAPLLAV